MNGWSNRNTWLLNVHGFYEGSFSNGQFETVEDLADAMESIFREWVDENTPKDILASDFFNTHGLDFMELAEAKAEQYVKPLEDDEPEEDEDEDDGNKIDPPTV